LINYDLAAGTIATVGFSVSSASMQPWLNGWYRCIDVTSSTTLATLVVAIVTSASAVRAQANPLTTSIYVAGIQMEEGTNATSYIPTGATQITRAADGLEEVASPYPSMSDACGSCVTTNHIGLPINGAETAAMSSLQFEASPGALDWGAELLFTS